MGDLIPITVLTGFLGAGKTTRLNRLPGQPEPANTTVPISAFGEVSLDHLPREWPNGDDRRSRLVFIARDLDRSVIGHGAAAFEQAAGPAHAA